MLLYFTSLTLPLRFFLYIWHIPSPLTEHHAMSNKGRGDYMSSVYPVLNTNNNGKLYPRSFTLFKYLNSCSHQWVRIISSDLKTNCIGLTRVMPLASVTNYLAVQIVVGPWSSWPSTMGCYESLVGTILFLQMRICVTFLFQRLIENNINKTFNHHIICTRETC